MSESKKHIVIVTSEFPPQPGGIGNHAHNLALYLTQGNYKVKVIADQRSLVGNEEKSFDKTQPFDIIRIKRFNLRFIMYLKRIQETYKSFRNTQCVIATGKFSLWNVAILSRFFKIKSLAVIHGSEVNFKSFFLRKSIHIALKRMNNIVAVSSYTKSLVSNLETEITVIPNGIDLSIWKSNEFSKIDLKGNPILTTVGRVSSRKGQLNVIKQLPELIKEFPDLHYHCVGIPTEAEAFISIAKQLNVESYVTFHGSVELKVLKQILLSTDIFVMLSSESKTGDVEGFGIAILEANALGVPAIGSKGCGIEDAIKPNVSGVLVAMDNTEEFKLALDAILKNKVTYQNEAKLWAEQHDWSSIIKQYMTLLD